MTHNLNAADQGTPSPAPNQRTAPAASGRGPQHVVAKFFDAFGRHDVEAIRQLLTDDIVEQLPGMPPIEGIDSECAFLEGLFAAFPDLQVEVTRLMAVDQVVAVAWMRRGTFVRGEFQGLPAKRQEI